MQVSLLALLLPPSVLLSRSTFLMDVHRGRGRGRGAQVHKKTDLSWPHTGPGPTLIEFNSDLPGSPPPWSSFKQGWLARLRLPWRGRRQGPVNCRAHPRERIMNGSYAGPLTGNLVPGLALSRKKVHSVARPWVTDSSRKGTRRSTFYPPDAVGEIITFPPIIKQSMRGCPDVYVDRLRSVITWGVVIVVPPQSF